MRLLSLRSANFMSGISFGAHTQDGLWYEAIGVNPFVDPSNLSVNSGLLQVCASPSDITSSVVVDVPFAGTSRATGSGAGDIYILGNAGHFYSLNALTLGSLADKRSGTPITNPACGMFIFQAAGGSEILYFLQKTQVGSWTMSASAYPTGWTDNWATGLQSSAIHPVHRFNDRVYIADLDRISMVYDNAGTPTLSLNVLDFPTGYVNTCLEDDGTYLIGGITRNQGDNVIFADTKIIFWDTFSASWNREWSIPDPTITAIKRIGSNFFAVCGRGIYRFSFDSAPVKIRSLSSATSIPNGYPNSIGAIGNAVVWGGGSTYLNSFGRIIEESPNSFHKPYAGFTGNQSLVMTEAKFGSIIVGTTQPKLYTLNTATPGGTASPQTVYFDLGAIFRQKGILMEHPSGYQITHVNVIFGVPLASTDDFSLDFKYDESTTATNWNSATYAVDGAIRRKTMFVKEGGASVIAEQLAMVLNFNGGNVKIKRLDIYGDPITK